MLIINNLSLNNLSGGRGDAKKLLPLHPLLQIPDSQQLNLVSTTSTSCGCTVVMSAAIVAASSIAAAAGGDPVAGPPLQRLLVVASCLEGFCCPGGG